MTQAFNLSQLANNLDSSGRLDATDGLVNAVPVANGGTGASSIAAAVANLSASIYPVGSIYINAGVTTNPATLLGFGTWSAFGAGRVLVGLNTSDSAFDVLQETGGSKDAIVVSHTHTGTTASAGEHNHTYQQYNGWNYLDGGPLQTPISSTSTQNTSTVAAHTHGFTTDPTGSSGTNANLQPYITVCMWLRTA